MNIELIDAKSFKQLFTNTVHVYNTTEFTELNREKCENVVYLAFYDKKARLGLIAGERNGTLHSPFSAPFGGFVSTGDVDIRHFDNAISLLAAEGKKATLTLPPAFYHPALVAKTTNAMISHGAKAIADLNYHYDLSRFPHYMQQLDSKTRNKLNNSLKQNFDLEVFNGNDSDITGIERAYRVIQLNRKAKGYPLRMSLNDVASTIKIIKADFFVLTLDSVDVAAAQVFHVADGIVQVIYWGDIPQYSSYRPMNYLAYELFRHYHRSGIRIVDVGPSSSDGIPNYGLCEFKESVGCEATLKFTLSIG